MIVFGTGIRNTPSLSLAKLADILARRGYEDRVMEVNFGSQSPERHQANQRETLR